MHLQGARRAGAALSRPALRRRVSLELLHLLPGAARQHGRARAAAVGALQRELSDATGIGGRLLRRRDDETTWMEIYESVPDGARFEAKLAELGRPARHSGAARRTDRRASRKSSGLLTPCA